MAMCITLSHRRDRYDRSQGCDPADPALQDFGPARFDAVGALERRDGVVWIKIHRVTAIKTSYKWLFLWDYTFYKWG